MPNFIDTIMLVRLPPAKVSGGSANKTLGKSRDEPEPGSAGARCEAAGQRLGSAGVS